MLNLQNSVIWRGAICVAGLWNMLKIAAEFDCSAAIAVYSCGNRISGPAFL